MHRKPLLTLTLGLLLAISACAQVTPTLEEETLTASRTIRPTQTRTPTFTPTPSLTATPTISPTPVTASLPGTTITFWLPWVDDTAMRYDRLAAQFTAENPWGITVGMRSFGSSQMLADALITGEVHNDQPALVIAPLEQLSYWHQKYDFIVDLSPYISMPGISLTSEDLAQFPAAFTDQEIYGDLRLGFPAIRHAQVLFYNQTWAQNLGFPEPPLRTAQISNQACAAAMFNNQDDIRDNNGTGGWIVNTGSLALLSWFYGFGAPPFPDDTSTVYNFQADPIVNAFTFLKAMAENGCAWISRNPSPHEYFARRYALLYSGTTADIPIQARLMEINQNGDTWTVIPYPSQDGKPILLTSGYSYAVIKTDANQQLAAWLFIRWLSQPEQVARLIETTASLPVNLQAVSLLTDYARAYPQWAGIVGLIPQSLPAPRQPAWRTIRLLLSDAGGNVFNPLITPTPIPFILEQLQTVIPEVLTISP